MTERSVPRFRGHKDRGPAALPVLRSAGGACIRSLGGFAGSAVGTSELAVGLLVPRAARLACPHYPTQEPSA